jgi:hypothetical protein
VDPASDDREITAGTRLALARNISMQGLGGEEGGVLLNLTSGEMYTINETGLAFLKELDGNRSIAEIADELVKAFDVDIETLTADLVELTDGLVDESLLAVVQ